MSDIVDRLDEMFTDDERRDDRLMISVDAADEITRLRAEVDDLKRINMNLRYLIPEAVWIDEADRLRGNNQESPANEIERLRSLIVYWCDVVDDLDGHPSDYHQNVAAAEDELRKAVGR